MRTGLYLLALLCVFCTLIPGSVSSQNPSAPKQPSEVVQADQAEESRLSSALLESFKNQKYEEALQLGKQLVALRERVYGADDPRVASGLADLAEVYLALEKNSDAERVYQRAVAILDKQPTAFPLLLSIALERLGNLAFAERDYSNAAQLLQRALTTRETVIKKDDPGLAAILHSLANTYQMLRRFDEAETLDVKALTLMEKELGKEHPLTIASMKDYACLKYNASTQDSKKAVDDPNRELRHRAECWLFGFKTDCATSTSKNFKPHEIVNGRAFSLPKPDYPARARAQRESGRVLMAVEIDEQGNVAKAKTICGGPPLLREPALRAVRGAKFSPTIVDGKPIQVTGIVTYNFVFQ